MGQLLIQKLIPEATVPTVVHPGDDLGFDVYAVEDTFLEHFKQKIVKTGIAALYTDFDEAATAKRHPPSIGFSGGWWEHQQKKYGLEVRDRSSMAAKHGIHAMAGEVDYGWRGEIGVVMILLGQPPQWHIHPDDEAEMERCLAGETPVWEHNERYSWCEHPDFSQQVRRGYQIKAGDKIAQIVPREVKTTHQITVVTELPPAARGLSGYGSSGR